MKKTAAYMHADLNRLDRETGMALATIDSLDAEEMVSASLNDNWTRAQVVAHLIGNARALTRLVNWAVTGEKQPMYASEEAREAEINELAALSPGELKQLFRETSEEFAKAAGALRDGNVATAEVEMLHGPVNVYDLPSYRISEVIVHHHDLDTLWLLEEADIDALEDALYLAVARIQARDDYPGLTIETDEGESFTVGDGATTLRGGRDAILGWITRGHTDGLRVEGDLPERPFFA